MKTIKDESVKRPRKSSAAKAKSSEEKSIAHSKPRATKTDYDKKSVASDSKYSHKANSPRDFQAVRDSIEAKIDAFFEANKESGLRKLVSASKLMEAGCHIGMAAKWWNPKMKPFTYPKKGKTQIIDILKTMVFLDRAYNFLRDITREGGKVLLVGTRGEIIKEHIKNEAKRAKAFYLNQRWLGGTLTNFKTINKSIDKLNKLIMLQLSDEIKKYSKKEQIAIEKETEKMGKFIGGIRTMRGVPQAIIVTDPMIEHNAIAEARKLKIPVIAFANTNANPDLVDFLIPANTGSIKTVYLLISIMCDAIAEGNGDPTNVVGKKDDEIILPEVIRKQPQGAYVNHKKFTRGPRTR